MINPNQRIVITGLNTFALQPMFESNAHKQAIADFNDSDDLMLESVTLEEVEHVYLGDSPLVQGDSVMFEAISTQRQQLATTMQAFTRVLNRGLNGTNISAGVENAQDGDDSGTVIGGALIGKVRRIAGVPVIAAKIPLSDGQSTSIIFHSPTSNGKTLVSDDLLVAFQFLINKRDVTHVVAPIGGKDVSLAQVAQALSNLIEKNSGKFKKQQALQKKIKDEISALQGESDKLENDRSNVMEQFNDAQSQASQAASQVSTLTDQLTKQKQINADLKRQLETLQNAPEPQPSQSITDNLRNVKQAINLDGKASLSDGSTVRVVTVDDGNPHTYAILQTAAGETYQLEAKDMQGTNINTAVGNLFKAYRAGKADKYKVDQPADTQPTQPSIPTPDDIPPPADPIEASKGSEPEPAQNTQAENGGNDGLDTVQNNLNVLAGALGKSAEAIGNWWGEHGTGSTDLETLTSAMTQSPTQTNISALNTAIDFGTPFNADNVKPVEEQSPAKEEWPEQTTEENEVPELDQQSNAAIEALKAMVNFESDDLKEIGDKIQEAINAAQTLVAGGVYDENESLINDASNHLTELMVAIQNKGG